MYRRFSTFIVPIWRLQTPANAAINKIGVIRESRLLSSAADDGSAKPTTKRQPIILNDDEIEEKHVRGWGNGGQKMNKTSSCVQLLHKPTNTMVICQETRYLQQNRKLARKRLAEKLDLLINGHESKIAKKIHKLQKRKKQSRKRSKRKYSTDTGNDENDSSEW
ncbi:hypothetical protein EV175_002135 [Coemansia sp. RSA 1933]|nr:hypothetical protein EV175_002135 [Coemansia sp. RSA 1933]